MSETAWMFAAVAFYSPAAIFFFFGFLVFLYQAMTDHDARAVSILTIVMLSVIFGTFCLVQWAKLPQGENIEAVSE